MPGIKERVLFNDTTKNGLVTGSFIVRFFPLKLALNRGYISENALYN